MDLNFTPDRRGANALAVLEHLQTTTGASWGFPIQVIDTKDLARLPDGYDPKSEDAHLQILENLPSPPLWEYDARKATAFDIDTEIGIGLDATSCIL